jgi:lipopolysaccharide export system ATP-binding protein
MKLLDVSGLAKRYGSRQVVNDVSFDVDAGEIVGLLGPNGAGKTTSFRMTCGMVTPDRGRVMLDGRDVTDWPMHRRAREGGLGYLPQQSSVFGKLTVEQNLVATMQLLGRPSGQRRQETAQLLAEFGLEHIRTTLSSQVSGGERRRLEIARCLVSHPKMIMLDEPFAGIDPITVQGIQEIIRQLANRGLGILITDHAAREILQITARTYVINEGAVLCTGTPTEVANHPEVKKKYLGVIDSFEPHPRPVSPTAAPVATGTSQNLGAMEPTPIVQPIAMSAPVARPEPIATPVPPMKSRPTRPLPAPQKTPVAREKSPPEAFIPLVPMNSSPRDFFRDDSDMTPMIVNRPEPIASPGLRTSLGFAAETPMAPLVVAEPESDPLVPQFAPHGRRFFPQPKNIRQGS